MVVKNNLKTIHKENQSLFVNVLCEPVLFSKKPSEVTTFSPIQNFGIGFYH